MSREDSNIVYGSVRNSNGTVQRVKLYTDNKATRMLARRLLSHMKKSVNRRVRYLHTFLTHSILPNSAAYLSALSEEENLKVTYFDMAELSQDGQNLCVIQLASSGGRPIGLFTGEGIDALMARNSAAYHALVYFAAVIDDIV